MATTTELKLIEKIVRAKVRLEGSKTSHSDNCNCEEPENFAPCNCGASAHNTKIDAALRELSLEE